MKNKNTDGFTLIELMIVVAIIGILASIALPAYQTYVAKSKVTALYATAATAKTAVFDFYVSEGRMPTHDEYYGADNRFEGSIQLLRDPSKGGHAWFTRLSATKAELFIKLININGHVNDKSISIWFEDNGDALSVTCTRVSSLDAKYVPKQCFGTI